MEIPRWDDWPHVLRMQQFSRATLELITEHAQRFEAALSVEHDLPKLSSRTKQRRLRTLFYEPSTRTETTVLDAAWRLGVSGHAVKAPGSFSSAVKGESFTEAIAAFTQTGGMGRLRGADLVVVRHKRQGSSAAAAKVTTAAVAGREGAVPVAIVNAGDGKGQHPTQALVDLMTIYQERKHIARPLDNLTVLFPGDLRRSRVINSLLYLFGRFGDSGNIQVIFCCPQGFGPKAGILAYLARHNVQYRFTASTRDFPQVVEEADIVYMNRVQRERKTKRPFLAKHRRRIVFQADYLDKLREGAFVMHPLPINRDGQDKPAEIAKELAPLAQAGDPRCAWLRQSHRGLPVRAALLDLIFAGMDEAEAGDMCSGP